MRRLTQRLTGRPLVDGESRPGDDHGRGDRKSTPDRARGLVRPRARAPRCRAPRTAKPCRSSPASGSTRSLGPGRLRRRQLGRRRRDLDSSTRWRQGGAVAPSGRSFAEGPKAAVCGQSIALEGGAINAARHLRAAVRDRDLGSRHAREPLARAPGGRQRRPRAAARPDREPAPPEHPWLSRLHPRPRRGGFERAHHRPQRHGQEHLVASDRAGPRPGRRRRRAPRSPRRLARA